MHHMRPTRFAFYLWLLVVAAAISGCGDDSAQGNHAHSGGAMTAEQCAEHARKPGDPPLKIVATTTMIADLAANIAGEDAVVQGIMKEGEDPHIYNVRPRDAQLIAAANVILLNGLHLEATLLHIVENNAATPFVALLAESDKITPLGLVAGGGATSGAPDPHCWFNVQYFKIYAEQTRDLLKEADPQHADAYESRAAAYIAQLDELDAWVQTQLDSIPKQQRIIVTSHDAFNYYGHRYGVEVHAVIGISTDQEPRPRDIIELEKIVKENGVKALFIETSVSATLNNIVRKVANSTGTVIGGTLFSDSLGPAEGDAGTYLGMVRSNTRIITKALK